MSKTYLGSSKLFWISVEGYWEISGCNFSTKEKNGSKQLPVKHVIVFYPLECPEEAYDPRSLYERLQEQKDKKQQEFEEQFKFSKSQSVCLVVSCPREAYSWSLVPLEKSFPESHAGYTYWFVSFDFPMQIGLTLAYLSGKV